MPKMVGKVIWSSPSHPASKSFLCGYCGNRVASNVGWDGSIPNSGEVQHGVRICPECSGPTLLGGLQVPGVGYGKQVNHLPSDIDALYNEARDAIAGSAPTAAVLCCRKLLMHVAVEKGAKEGQSFQSYVNHLADNNFVPAGARAWVDEIRTKSNEANHQIVIKTVQEAEELIDFVEMLLMVVYDYPSRAKPPASPGTGSGSV